VLLVVLNVSVWQVVGPSHGIYKPIKMIDIACDIGHHILQGMLYFSDNLIEITWLTS
jgi:hypothetical protein